MKQSGRAAIKAVNVSKQQRCDAWTVRYVACSKSRLQCLMRTNVTAQLSDGAQTNFVVSHLLASAVTAQRKNNEAWLVHAS